MTPCNVCAMARLKGLDLIALTDHNTGGNLQAFQEAAQREGLLFLPGMELCTREEVHLLAYFPDVASAMRVSEAAKSLLPAMKNRPDFFGRQLLMDSQDQLTGEEDALLIGALDADLATVYRLVRSQGGVPVPAHIHRGYGLVQVLGFIPGDAGFHAVETAAGTPAPPGHLALHSSDAHQLGMIAEREQALPVEGDITKVLALLSGRH